MQTVLKKKLVFKKEKDENFKCNILVVLPGKEKKTVYIESQVPFNELPDEITLEEKIGVELDEYPMYTIYRQIS